jgi:hypothetical protein
LPFVAALVFLLIEIFKKENDAGDWQHLVQLWGDPQCLLWLFSSKSLSHIDCPHTSMVTTR